MEREFNASLATNYPSLWKFVSGIFGRPYQHFFPSLCRYAREGARADLAVIFAAGSGIIWPISVSAAAGVERGFHSGARAIAASVIEDGNARAGAPLALPLFDRPAGNVVFACRRVRPAREGITYALYVERLSKASAFTSGQLEELAYLGAAAGVHMPQELSRPDPDIEHGSTVALPPSPAFHDPAGRMKRFGLRHLHAGIVGEAPAMIAMLRELDIVLEHDVPVLIVGETGTGKGLVAQEIARHGTRAGKVFEAHNAAAIPGDLLESEMFGYVKGAFHGADKDTAGFFERADRATLFLDEVAELAWDHQAKLLQALDPGGCFYRLGDRTPRKADVRVISATNADIDQRVEQKKFRADLLHRLDGERVRMPALRDRKGDIPLLLRHHLGDLALRFGPPSLSALEAYDWPGNVRQLFQVAGRLVRRCPTLVTAADVLKQLPPSAASMSGGREAEAANRAFRRLSNDEKRRVLRRELDSERGNIAAVARKLGYREYSLRRLMARLDVSADRRQSG